MKKISWHNTVQAAKRGVRKVVGDKDGKHYVSGVAVEVYRGQRGGLTGFIVRKYEKHGGVCFGLSPSQARALIRKLTKELK